MNQVQFVGVEPETLIQAIVERVAEKLTVAVKDTTNTEVKDRYLTLKEAAEFLNLKPASIYNKTASRELPHIKRGNRLYFLESDLREYLNGGRQMTKDEVESMAADYCNQKSGRKTAMKGGRV